MLLIGAAIGAMSGSLAAAAVVALKDDWYLVPLCAAGAAIAGAVGGALTGPKPSCAAAVLEWKRERQHCQ